MLFNDTNIKLLFNMPKKSKTHCVSVILLNLLLSLKHCTNGFSCNALFIIQHDFLTQLEDCFDPQSQMLFFSS